MKGPNGEPVTCEVGDVAYMAAFPGGFVQHDIEAARKAAEAFRHLSSICVYRIEVVEVLEQAPTPPRAKKA